MPLRARDLAEVKKNEDADFLYPLFFQILQARILQRLTRSVTEDIIAILTLVCIIFNQGTTILLLVGLLMRMVMFLRGKVCSVTICMRIVIIIRLCIVIRVGKIIVLVKDRTYVLAIDVEQQLLK